MLDALDVMRSPAWYPLRFTNSGEMTMLHLDEAAYRSASFLDQRLLALGRPQTICPLNVLEAAAAALPRPPHFLFHIGHVGSTLISRLIGAHPGFFSLREPELLRSLANEELRRPGVLPAHGELTLDLVLALLARTWRPGERAVVKATSIANELAGLVLGGNDRPSAIFVYADPLAYLRGILGGPNSRLEARALAPGRLQRLKRRLVPADPPFDPRSEGEVIAMNWLSEISALHQTGMNVSRHVHWVNFDDFLKCPAAGLKAIFRAFGVSVAYREIEVLTTGPLMRQYSKAPEYAYDAEVRRDVLQSAGAEHAAEIARGMHWLEQRALRHPLAHAVLHTHV